MIYTMNDEINARQSRIKAYRVFDEYLCERCACAEPNAHVYSSLQMRNDHCKNDLSTVKRLLANSVPMGRACAEC
jgi:hypothetical protein